VLLTNLISIAIYTSIAMALYEPVYAGFTVGVWVILIELMIILARKYQQNNYSYKSFEVVLSLIGILAVFLTWLLFMVIRILANETNKVFMILTAASSIIFFFGAISGLLISEL
jgi:hypothetical protein